MKILAISCFKTTSDINKFGKMHVIWKDNSQYRVFTNLCRNFAQEIMNKEDLTDKYGYTNVNKYKCKTTQALESFWNQREPSRTLPCTSVDVHGTYTNVK